MRKVLLAVLFTVAVCPNLFAIWPFSRKAAPAVDDPNGVRAVLASLAPTETEAKAIARLREKSSAQQQHAIDFVVAETPGQANVDVPALKLPVEAAPIPTPNDVYVSVECSYITVKQPLAQMITGDPAMSWTGLPVVTKIRDLQTEVNAGQAVLDGITPGTASSRIGTETPIHVRFLENDNAAKFCHMIQSQSTAGQLQAPRVLIASGQMGSVSNTNQTPFVTSVITVQGDLATAIQPVIQILSEGIAFTVMGTLLQDDSYRLEKFRFENQKIKEVRNYKLVDGDPDNFKLVETKKGPYSSKADTKPTTKSGVTIQAPVTSISRISLPEVVIPEGMSLLVAFPGCEVYEPDGNREQFLLITPKRVELEEFLLTGRN